MVSESCKVLLEVFLQYKMEKMFLRLILSRLSKFYINVLFLLLFSIESSRYDGTCRKIIYAITTSFELYGLAYYVGDVFWANYEGNVLYNIYRTNIDTGLTTLLQTEIVKPLAFGVFASLSDISTFFFVIQFFFLYLLFT